MSKDVYVFRGAPASGKGTVVPLFCKMLTGPVALIEQDMFRWDIHLIGRGVADITDEEHRLALRTTVATYKEYLKKGMHTLVLEGLFTYDDLLSSQGNTLELRELAEKYDYKFTSVVLKALKEELLARNAKRDYVVPGQEFNRLYDGVYGSIGAEEIIIDSTHESVESTVDLIVRKVTHAVLSDSPATTP